MADTAEATDTTDTTAAEVVDNGDGDTANKSFTQEEVNRIVESRLARERGRYSDYDEVKAKANAYDEFEEAQKSELQKERESRERAEAERDTVWEQFQSTTIRSKLLAEAAKSNRNIVDPEGAVEFLLGADSDLLRFDDESGDLTDVAKAMDDLLEKRTYLIASDTSRPTPEQVDQGARGGSPAGQVTEAQLKTMSPHEIVKAREEGRLDSLVRGA